MDRFFSEVKNTVNNAVKKSGELVELTKIKIAVGDTKSAIKLNYEKLGELAYLTAKGAEMSGDEAEQLILKIDELRELLAQQEAKLAELTNKKICSHCERVCQEESAFCPSCGNPFGSAE